MYFKHKYQNSENIRTTKIESLSFNQQINRIKKLYSTQFTPYFKKHINHYKNYGITNAEQKWKSKSIEDLNWEFKRFSEILTVLIQNKWSINQYFKQIPKPLMVRSAFFSFKRQVFKMCNSANIQFDYYLNKTSKPKNIKYIYRNHLREIICNYCYKYLENGLFYDYTSIWLEIRKSVNGK